VTIPNASNERRHPYAMKIGDSPNALAGDYSALPAATAAARKGEMGRG
jgi:hypothetical protein